MLKSGGEARSARDNRIRRGEGGRETTLPFVFAVSGVPVLPRISITVAGVQLSTSALGPRTRPALSAGPRSPVKVNNERLARRRLRRAREVTCRGQGTLGAARAAASASPTRRPRLAFSSAVVVVTRLTGSAVKRLREQRPFMMSDQRREQSGGRPAHETDWKAAGGRGAEERNTAREKSSSEP